MKTNYFLSFMKEEDIKKIKELTTINELEEFCLKNYPDLIAVATRDFTKTYPELFADVATTRGDLKQLGVKKGDHVAILLKNEYDFMRLFLAITTSGCVAVLFPMLTPLHQLSAVITKMDVKFLVYSTDFTETIPALNLTITSVPQTYFKGDTPVAEDDKVTKDTNAAIIFTGGTTGASKGVVLTHGNIMRGTINGAIGFQQTFHERYFTFIPFTHVFGIIRNGLTVLYTGSQIFMCEDMKNLFKDLPLAKPTTLVLVPALAEMVWGIIVTRGMEAIGGSLKQIICGGATVPPKIIIKLAELGITVYPGYGLTETTNLVSGNGNPLAKPTSVGNAYPHQELKVVNNELWIKGENVMSGYYNDPIANKESFEDGWFKTGDLVKIDADNDLYIIGRSKNVIVLDNGENVSPEELEGLIDAIPFVQNSLVMEGKNALGHAIIMAEVLPNMKVVEKMNISNVAEAIQNAIDKINQGHPLFMKIAKVVIRTEDFARSPSMKIIRKQVNL